MPHTDWDYEHRPGYKTKLCYYYKKGQCNAGDKCSFAHDDVANVMVCRYWDSHVLCPHGWVFCYYLHPDRLAERYRPLKHPFTGSVILPVCTEQKKRQQSISNYAFWNHTPTPDVLPRSLFSQDKYACVRKAAKIFQWSSKVYKDRSKEEEQGRQKSDHTARQMEIFARELNAEASRSLFRLCNPDYPTSRWIDLHGQHVHEALQYIHHWLLNYPSRTDWVYIVTGAGRHSINAPKLGPAVEDYLTKHFAVRELSFTHDLRKCGGTYAIYLCEHIFWKTDKGNLECKRCPWVKKKKKKCTDSTLSIHVN